MLQTAHDTIRRVGVALGLNDQEIEELLATNAEHEFDITMESGAVHKAYRVQHNNKLGPYKGGIRFHPEVDKEEVRALATLMSFKTAAVGLPLGGGKGGVSVDPRSLSPAELEEISRKFVRALHPHIGPEKDVPAPDVNTNPQIIDWMSDEYTQITGDKTGAAFTGKSLAHGGSAGRDAATGRGGVIVLSEVLQHLDDQSLSRGITYAVQGFGNVGAFFGLVAAKDYPAWHMVAASDSSAGVFDQAGLDPQVIDDWKKSRRALHDFTDATVITNEQLIAADVDVLVLAALGDSVTASNMHDVKAKIILELANAPVSDEAYEYLTKRGVLIVPDILANAGGVIVSYLEWMQNKHGEHWTEVAVNTKLGVYLRDATAKIYTVSERRGMSLKDAAFAVAIERLSNRGEIIA